MAVVNMSKIKLIGLSYEKEKILNTLHKSGLVELRATEELENTFVVSDERRKDEIKATLDRTNKCIDFFIDHLSLAKKESYAPKSIEGLESQMIVGYDEFMSAPGNEIELSYIIDKLEEYSKRLITNKANRVKLVNLKTQLTPYLPMKEKFSDFTSTAKTTCLMGLISEFNIEPLKNFLVNYPLVDFSLIAKGTSSIISLIIYNDDINAVSSKLSELAFQKCPFEFDMTAQEKTAVTDELILQSDRYSGEINKKVVGKSNNLRNLKILADYYSFQLEKIEASEKFRCTTQTFTLEGYLPSEEVTNIKNDIYNISTAVFIEFSEPTADEVPPTLLKNNKLAKQAEFITNMYSTPNYREIDPNGIVFVFFMTFFGLIMADIGYGIVLMLIGFIMSKRIKVDNGMKKLVNIIGIGGFFTVIFGLLFGSMFGVTLYSFLPDPTGESRSDVLIILLGCLACGVVQVSAGYVMKALNDFKKGNIWAGILDSLLWVVFFIGLVMAAFNFLMDYFSIPVAAGVTKIFAALQMPGIILIAVSLLIIVVTAGRNQKGFGKITKGFGSIYGIINLFSDVLSYARLFGLMLSGMIIAQQFNAMGMGLITGGSLGIVFGPIVILIGHVFNLVMGVLGAYIHVSRLQYIEFFSKFYEGEGDLFKPLGSEFNYIYLTK